MASMSFAISSGGLHGLQNIPKARHHVHYILGRVLTETGNYVVELRGICRWCSEGWRLKSKNGEERS